MQKDNHLEDSGKHNHLERTNQTALIILLTYCASTIQVLLEPTVLFYFKNTDSFFTTPPQTFPLLVEMSGSAHMENSTEGLHSVNSEWSCHMIQQFNFWVTSQNRKTFIKMMQVHHYSAAVSKIAKSCNQPNAQHQMSGL